MAFVKPGPDQMEVHLGYCVQCQAGEPSTVGYLSVQLYFESSLPCVHEL